MSSKNELIALCKEKKIKGYSGKSKEELIKLLSSQIKSLGQYFTISNTLQQFVFDKVNHKDHLLLEPSFGAGHLLKKFNSIPIISGSFYYSVLDWFYYSYYISCYNA